MRAQSVLLPGVILTLVFSIPLHSAGAAEPPQVQYLGDDLADRISDVIQAWGELGFNERAVCIIEYTVENPQAKPAEVALVLTFLTSAKNNQHAELREIEGGITALSGGRLMGLVSTAGAGPLAARAEAGAVSLSGKLPAGGTARLLVLG